MNQAYSSAPSECYSILQYLESTSLTPSRSEDRTMLHDTLLFLSVPAPEISSLSLIHPSWWSLIAPRPDLTFNQCDKALEPTDPLCDLPVLNNDTSEPPAMPPGSVPQNLAYASEPEFVPVPMPVTPVFYSNELASPLPPPIPQVLSFANEAEYSPKPACIDPSLLNIAPSAPATNANLTSPPSTQRPGTADEASNVGGLSLHGAPQSQPEGLFLMVPYYSYPYPGPVHMGPIAGPVHAPLVGQVPMIPHTGPSHMGPVGGAAHMGPITGSAHIGPSAEFGHDATKTLIIFNVPLPQDGTVVLDALYGIYLSNHASTLHV
ncbi:hypothetical protein BDR06DRAFT_1070111 [Suillus hirtellus]|nr:hypothetical protein BDR06DRAFT_1070111 [Suillus hirtellus]